MKKVITKWKRNGEKKVKKIFDLKNMESYMMYVLKNEIIDYYKNNIIKDGEVCFDDFEILYRVGDEDEVQRLSFTNINYKELLKLRKSYLYLNMTDSDGMFRLIDLYFENFLKTKTNTLMFVVKEEL